MISHNYLSKFVIFGGGVAVDKAIICITMISKEELQETYSGLSNEKLMEIVDNKHEYTDSAILVAIKELNRRKLSEEDIKLYKQKQVEEAQSFIKKFVVDDLKFWEKSLFYFIKISFITGAIKTNAKLSD